MFGLGLWLRIGYAGAIGVATSVISWIFSLISNNSTTVTNATALVWLNDAEIADGMSIVTLPDDTPIQNGVHWDSTTETYSFTMPDGTKVAKTELLQTSNGAVEVLANVPDWRVAESVAAGDVRKVSTTEGLPVWVQYTAAGTTAGSQPVTSITSIGSSTPVTDNDTSYLVRGLQTAEGLFSGLAATNYLLNSDAPATQTTGSLATGFYTLWMDGTGSADLTAGTATIVSAGSATDGSPLTFEVTVAGTVTVTVAGTEDRFQLEGGTVPTQFIVTAGSTVTRSATVTETDINLTRLTPEKGYGVIVARLDRADQSNVYLSSSYVDVSNYEGVFLLSGTTVFFRKVIAGATSQIPLAYNYAANDLFIGLYSWDEDGMKFSYSLIGGTFPTPATNANADNVVLGATLETGSRNGANQFSGEIPINATFSSWEQAVQFASKYADVSNL